MAPSMRFSRLRPLLLPVLAALLFAIAVRGALRCLGENLVPLLRRGPTMAPRDRSRRDPTATALLNRVEL